MTVSRYLSPLRYPGGKGRLAPYIASIARQQRPRPTAYAEPFAGGAGAALRLLFDEEVDTIHLNDLDAGIAALWRAIVGHTTDFAQLIRTHPVTVEAWHEARSIYESPRGRSDVELGFATFFLNRCNRSGILTARPIGGLEQQGNWKIDARFNREPLAQRVEQLGRYRRRIKVTQLDARTFLDDLASRDDADRLLVYVDPPYLGQGDDLYLDALTLDDHSELAQQLKESPLKWFLTYDADVRVTDDLYSGLRCVEFDIAHTAQRQHVGSEYAVFSDALVVPEGGLMRRGSTRAVASGTR